MAEREIAELQNGESVHLPGALPLSVNQDGALHNFFLQAFAHAIRAASLCVDGPLDVRCSDGGPRSGPRPVIGFAQQIGQGAQMRHQFPGIFSQPRAVLDQAGHCIAAERGHVLLARDGGDEPRVEMVVLCVAVHAVFEVRLHLEELAKFRIVSAQQVIQQPLTKKHYLDLQGDGLRVERNRAHQAEHLSERLDADLAAAQSPLQPLPGVRLHQ